LASQGTSIVITLKENPENPVFQVALFHVLVVRGLAENVDSIENFDFWHRGR
jgi:hypothetical protein